MNAWIARNLLYRPATWVRGEHVFPLLAEYERSQWWTPEQVRAAQEERLRDLLRYAAREVPRYQESARAAGLDPARIEATDLAAFPVLEKTELQENLAAVSGRALPGATTWKTTGGSTGVPVRLRKNRAATAAEQAASWRSYGWYGIRPGDRQARFWGVAMSGAARTRYRAIDWVLNRDRFSAFAFGPEDLRRYHEVIRRRRPAWVYGYVSMLVQFATYCLEEGLPLADVGVRAVVTTSEVLSPSDRRLLTEAFSAPVFDEYGCGEVGAILYECEKGRMHLMAENLFVELVPDPTPDEPQAARLLVTDLHNRATVLVRYDIQDRVVPAPDCPCGRGLPAFERVFGRAYDFIEAPDGTRFHGEFFMYLLERARDRGLPIRQAQFVETAPGEIEIRVVPGPGYSPEAGRTIGDWLVEASEGRFKPVVATAEQLDRTRSGKLRLIQADPRREACG